MEVKIWKCKADLENALKGYGYFLKECYADIRMIQLLKLTPEEYLHTLEAEFPKMAENATDHFRRIRLVMDVCHDGIWKGHDNWDKKYNNLMKEAGWDGCNNLAYGTLNRYIEQLKEKAEEERKEPETDIRKLYISARIDRWGRLKEYLTREDEAEPWFPAYLREPIIVYLKRCLKQFFEETGKNSVDAKRIKTEFDDMVYRDRIYTTSFHDVIWNYRSGQLKRTVNSDEKYSWGDE
jgi:hypothetical protein